MAASQNPIAERVRNFSKVYQVPVSTILQQQLMYPDLNDEFSENQKHIRYTPCAFEDCDNEALHLEPNGNLGYCLSHFIDYD